AAAPSSRTEGRPGEPTEVRHGDLVERECPAEAEHHLVRGLVVAALLETQVVLGADAGEGGHFLSAESAHTPVRFAWEPDVLGLGQVAPCAEVLTDQGSVRRH